jgi:hypothetical protein
LCEINSEDFDNELIPEQWTIAQKVGVAGMAFGKNARRIISAAKAEAQNFKYAAIIQNLYHFQFASAFAGYPLSEINCMVSGKAVASDHQMDLALTDRDCCWTRCDIQ